MTAEVSANGIRPFQSQPAKVLPATTAREPAVAPEKAVAATAKQRVQIDAAEMQRNVKEAIERLNEQMRKTGRNLNFSMDDKIDRMVITVKNSETGEVVRQIPDEAIVKAAHQIEELKGLLHNSVT